MHTLKNLYFSEMEMLHRLVSQTRVLCVRERRMRIALVILQMSRCTASHSLYHVLPEAHRRYGTEAKLWHDNDLMFKCRLFYMELGFVNMYITNMYKGVYMPVPTNL